MKTQHFTRSRFIVDPVFQYGIIRKIVFMSGLMIIMSLSFLTLMYYFYGDVQIELIQPDPFSSTETLNTMAGQRSLMDLLWPVMAGCLLVTLVVTLGFGVLVSHRMAGPIFHFQRVLAEMSGGDLRGEIRLREKDDFQPIADAINKLKRDLRTDLQKLKRISNELADMDGPEKENALKTLQATLSGYRLE